MISTNILYEFKNLSVKQRQYLIAVIFVNILLPICLYNYLYLPQQHKLQQIQAKTLSMYNEQKSLTHKINQLKPQQIHWQTFIQKNSKQISDNKDLTASLNISNIMQNLIELINASNLKLLRLEPNPQQNIDINIKYNDDLINKQNNNLVQLHTQGTYNQIINFLNLVNKLNLNNEFIWQIQDFTILSIKTDDNINHELNFSLLLKYHKKYITNTSQTNAIERNIALKTQNHLKNPFFNIADSNEKLPLTIWNIKDLHYLGLITDETQNNIAIISDTLNNIYYVRENDKIGSISNTIKKITTNAVISNNSKYNLYREN